MEVDFILESMLPNGHTHNNNSAAFVSKIVIVCAAICEHWPIRGVEIHQQYYIINIVNKKSNIIDMCKILNAKLFMLM